MTPDFMMSAPTPGPAGHHSAHGRHAAAAALRRSFRALAERRHGLGARAHSAARNSSSSAPKEACAPPMARPSPLDITPATGRSDLLVAGRRRGTAKPQGSSLRRVLHRSLRRPHAGHHRDVRQPALPQRCRRRSSPPDPLAAHARAACMGVATCDKGLPAMMMALAGSRDLPSVLVPGGVTLMPDRRRGRGQSADDRRALRPRKNHACRKQPRWAAAPAHRPAEAASFSALPPPRRWSREALGMALPHSALAPSGQPIWLDMATRSARAVLNCSAAAFDRATSSPTPRSATRWSFTPRSADPRTSSCTFPPSPTPPGFAGPPWPIGQPSTPRCRASWTRSPTGRAIIPTVQVFLAGGVPEVMLHLRRLGVARYSRAHRLRRNTRRRTRLVEDSPSAAPTCATACKHWMTSTPTTSSCRPRPRAASGFTSTVCFPTGNLAPEGSVIKSTSIDPTVVDGDGVYRKTGPARVFTSETAGIAAIKRGDNRRPEISLC